MSLSTLDAAMEAPDRIALVCGDRQVSYAALAEHLAARMGRLERLGLSGADGESRAVLTPEHGIDAVVTLHALIELGVTAALLHPRLTERERRRQIELAQPAMDLDALETSDESAGAPPGAPRRGIDPERPLAILFTSGTTGAPEGVELSRRAFLAAAAASAANLGWKDDDRWLLCISPAHVGGLSILTRCLIARACAAVMPEFDPVAFVETVTQCGVTLASLVPTMLQRILDASPTWRPPPSLRAILLGGSAAPAALIEESADRGLPVLTTYGLTEACSQVATQPLGTRPSPRWGAGRPLPGIEVRVRRGEIQVRGPVLLSRRLGVGAGSRVVDDDGWFDTGDRGEFDGEGNLHVIGRGCEIVVTGGENVSVREVEEVLASCPGLASACVFGIEDREWGEAIAAALVADGGGAPSDGELARFVISRLAGFKRPKRIGYLEGLPLTPTGKVDRAATRERVLARLRAFPDPT